MKDEWYGRPVTCPFCGQQVIVGYQGYMPPPNQMQYMPPPVYANSKPGSNTASLVLGICGLIFWLSPIIGFFVSVAGIVVGCVQKYIPGIVMSIIGLVLSLFYFMVSFILIMFWA